MSKWEDIGYDDMEIDGEEMNIRLQADNDGSRYAVIKTADIVKVLNYNGIKPLLCDVLGIAKQEINVYEMPDGDFAFANAGIISDGFPSREQAEIAAYRAVLSGIIATIEAEHFA